MRKLMAVWQSLFDVREGELALTLPMTLYLLFVMFAYYVLKPVSRAMFLSEFKVDKVPYLNMLIAVAGGVLAYYYSGFAARRSLRSAVAWTMGLASACLAAFWWLTGLKLPWMMYVFNVWVSLFSAILVSQGWLVAANIFDARSAKRLYGLLGFGAVIGAAFGGAFTAFMAGLVGTRNLLLAAVALIGLAWAAFLTAARRKGEGFESARGGAAGDSGFSMRDILVPIASSRHLRLIVAVFGLTFVVGSVVDYQFQAMASAAYQDDELTAFFGRFQGIYLNAVTLPLQFFLTAAVVRRLGVGGTLQIMPASIAAASVAIIAVPGLGSTMAAELAESSTRYTVNRTATELLYLPLPSALRNRIKTFVDVFVDRMSRGLGGLMLAVLLAAGFSSVRQLAFVSVVLCAVWIYLCFLARGEYIQTVRDRLARRRLELESSRVSVDDPETIRLLEQAARGTNPRPAGYALGMLAEAVDYDVTPLLDELARSPLPEVRGKVYEVAWFVQYSGLSERALEEVRAMPPANGHPAIRPAVEYALSFGPEADTAALEFLDHPNPAISESAIRALRMNPVSASRVLSRERIAEWVDDNRPARRRLAALAIAARGELDSEWLGRLLRDLDPGVASAACLAAAALGNRRWAASIADRLGDPRVRGDAIEALATFGPEIAGILGDLLGDERVPPSVRTQIPRVLRLVPNQRSVDALIQHLGHSDINIRAAVLKALNRLRDKAPGLVYGETYVARHILAEARHYFELHAAMAAIAARMESRTATGLLARTLEHRASQTIERLFRLLGLRYSQRDMYAAYRSLCSSRGQEAAAALELLENVLDHSLRRVVMPLLDAPHAAIEKGHHLFGIEVGTAESALRELISSGDPWLAACAIAAAAEQGLQTLAPEIEAAGGRSGAEVAEVAKTARWR